MNRRAFLSAGGIALGAGCSSLVGDSGETNRKPPAECAIDPNVTPGKPGWPSEAGGPKNTRSVPSAGVPTPPLKLDWTFRTGGNAAVPEPVIENGTVYATNFDNEVHAVDAKTGEHRWRADIQVNSRVAVVGNRLFVVSDGSLRALDTKTGDEVWTTDSTVDSSTLSSGIQVTEKTVFVYGALFLSAFDAKTGKGGWKCRLGGIESIAVDGGHVYAGLGPRSYDLTLHALTVESGAEWWSSAAYDSGFNDGIAVSSSQIVVATDVSQYGIALGTLNPRTGKRTWHDTKSGVNYVRGLSVDDGAVYVGGRKDDQLVVARFVPKN